MFIHAKHGDSVSVISWVSYRERGSWKFDCWFHNILDVSVEVGYSFGFLAQFTKL